MFILTWLTGLLRHRAARLTGSVLGVAMTVALLGSLGVFFAASKAQMTRQALAGVVVDWQVPPAPSAAPASAGPAPPGGPGGGKNPPGGYAGAQHRTATTARQCGSAAPGCLAARLHPAREHPARRGVPAVSRCPFPEARA